MTRHRYEERPAGRGMGRFVARPVGEDYYYLTNGEGNGLFFMSAGELRQLTGTAQFRASTLEEFKRRFRRYGTG